MFSTQNTVIGSITIVPQVTPGDLQRMVPEAIRTNLDESMFSTQNTVIGSITIVPQVTPGDLQRMVPEAIRTNFQGSGAGPNTVVRLIKNEDGNSYLQAYNIANRWSVFVSESGEVTSEISSADTNDIVASMFGGVFPHECPSGAVIVEESGRAADAASVSDGSLEG